MGGLLDIGRLLVAARRKRGISQRELGEAVGVKQQQIARWESSAYRTASLERLSRVAEVLDVGRARKEATPAPIDPPGPVRTLEDVVYRIREHGPVLEDRFGVLSVDVFGAFARGEQTENCFVGLIVELDRPTIAAMIDSEMYLQGILGRRVQAGPLSSITLEVRPEVVTERVHVWP